MRSILGAKAFMAMVVLASAPVSLGAAARPHTTVLSLTNSASQLATPYSFAFVASDTTMTMSIGGYQLPSFENVTDVAVTQGDTGRNLLGSRWTFTAAAQGSDAFTFKDPTYIPALAFGGVSAGYYDTFSQVVETVIGDSYTLSFLFTNNAYGPASADGPSGLLVSYHPDGPLPGGGSGGGAGSTWNTGVPEPSTWAMMLLGFAALGYAGQRRRRAKLELANV
jgi:hypothetical protein